MEMRARDSLSPDGTVVAYQVKGEHRLSLSMGASPDGLGSRVFDDLKIRVRFMVRTGFFFLLFFLRGRA